MHIARAWPAVLLLLPAVLLVPRTTGGAAELQLGPRSELTHPGKGHEVHASAPALAVTSDGTPLVTWATEEGQDKHVYLARMGDGAAKPVRVRKVLMRFVTGASSSTIKILTGVMTQFAQRMDSEWFRACPGARDSTI